MFGLTVETSQQPSITDTVLDPPRITRRGSNKRLISKRQMKKKSKKAKTQTANKANQKQGVNRSTAESSKRRRSTPLQAITSPVTRSMRKRTKQQWYESTPEAEQIYSRSEDALTRMIGTRSVDDDHPTTFTATKLTRVPSEISSQQA